MKVNLNTPVTVHLTEEGKKVWDANMEEVRRTYPDAELVVVGEPVSVQLWELMHIFGPRVGIGMPELFTTNYIDINIDEMT